MFYKDIINFKDRDSPIYFMIYEYGYLNSDFTRYKLIKIFSMYIR